MFRGLGGAGVHGIVGCGGEGLQVQAQPGRLRQVPAVQLTMGNCNCSCGKKVARLNAVLRAVLLLCHRATHPHRHK